MAFDLRDLIRFAQKLKRWWDRRQTSQDSLPQPDYHHQQPFEVQPGSQPQGPTNDAHYVGLRNQAIQEGNLMKQRFDEAHQAYGSGARGRAKDLSNQGHAHQRNRDGLNKQAAEWIFKEKNRHSPPDTIDLHGLYVQESIAYTESFIERQRRLGGSRTLRVIVGKGLHSAHQAPRIKPAIEKMVTKYDLAVRLDPHNTGVLLLDLGAGRAHRGIDGDVSRGLEKPSDESCLLM